MDFIMQEICALLPPEQLQSFLSRVAYCVTRHQSDDFLTGFF
jgi:hypothetical protein